MTTCALRIACPRCGAELGSACHYPGGQMLRHGAHSARERAARA